MFLVDGVEFELWCVAERESGLRARRHNKIQQPLNDAQMLAAWLLSIKGAHNRMSIVVRRWNLLPMASSAQPVVQRLSGRPENGILRRDRGEKHR